MVSVSDKNFNIEDADNDFQYQLNLTHKLDLLKSEFDQNVINEIVLWKVNRYVEMSKESLDLLNLLQSNTKVIDIELTKRVILSLLNTKGIQLPMASTILRFRNPSIYQIIDQRVFRLLYNDRTLKVKSVNNKKNNDEQIDLYLKYLNDLHKVCCELDIPFESSDRILYMADKRVNKNSKLLNY